MENTWINAFGFKNVGPSKKQKIKLVNLLIINGTGLLEKMLLPTGKVDGQTTTMPGHATNTVGCHKTDCEASGSLTPVHVSRGHDVGNDFKIKDHENPCPSTGNSAGLMPEDLSPPAEEYEIKMTLGRTSPLSVAEVKLDTLPAADCEDNMQIKSEADDVQEGKFSENNGKLVAENTVAELNHEDKSISSHIHSLAIHVTVDADPCSRSYDEIGKGESCPSRELSVQAALIMDKTESNLNIKTLSACSANEEDKRSCVVPVGILSVTMDGKPDNHDLKTIAGGHIQSLTEAKGSNNITNQVSIGEEYSASAVDNGVTRNGYVQQREAVKNKTGPLSPELEHSSMSIDVMKKLNVSKSVETHKVEMNDVAIKLGMKHEGFNDAGTTTPTLNISNEVCGEVMAKPTLNCGGSQLHGEDGIHSSGMEKGLALK
jgi:hypothetical protein